MIDYYEALREMHCGNVVKYVGTVNGNVMSDRGASFCMCRGCIFLFDKGEIKWNKLGYMVYDPDFRYELTPGEHAEAHRLLYEQHGHWQDYVAWQGLAQLDANFDAAKEAIMAGSRKGGQTNIRQRKGKKFGNFQNVMKAPGKLKAYVARVRGNINGNDDFYTIVPNVDHRNRQNTNFTADMHEYGIPIENAAYLDNCYNYCETFFARFALALLKFSIDNDPSKMKYIPMVDFSRTYTEDELFDMAEFTDEEREIIMNTLSDYHNRRK